MGLGQMNDLIKGFLATVWIIDWSGAHMLCQKGSKQGESGLWRWGEVAVF